MARVVNVDAQTVTVEMNSGKQRSFPVEDVAYENPKVGDVVNLYKDEDGSIFIDLPDEEAIQKTAKAPGKGKGDSLPRSRPCRPGCRPCHRLRPALRRRPAPDGR